MGKIKNAAKAIVIGSVKVGISVAVPVAGAAILANDVCKVSKKITGKKCGKIATTIAVAATLTGTNL